jgi:Winged helix DNA-binding domain
VVVTGLTELNWRQVAAWRVHRHHLAERAPRRALLDVVADICGLHAQVMSSAELALWARVEGLRRNDVEAALWKRRSLVKTWAMRGTLHLLPAIEYPTWQAAWSTYKHFLRPSWHRAFGVTAKELDRLIAAIAKALENRCLTREELADEVARLTRNAALGAKLRESWGAVLKPASFRGQLCFGPNSGRNVTFTRPDTWLKVTGKKDPDAAFMQIARRFLAVNGPASREDFARWWGMSPAAAKKRIVSLGDDVTEIDVEGSRMWILAEDFAAAARAKLSRHVRLLPAFDQYVVAATLHADDLLVGASKELVYRAQGWLSPVVLVDGRMAGVWRHERTAGSVAVTIEPFRTQPAWVRRAVEEEALNLAAYLGRDLTIVWQ